jgi:hypothetical protein
VKIVERRARFCVETEWQMLTKGWRDLTRQHPTLPLIAGGDMIMDASTWARIADMLESFKS